MALDAQRNWTVSMAENLDQIMRGKSSGDEVIYRDKLQSVDERRTERLERHGAGSISHEWTTPPIYLPDEIIIEILEYVSRSEGSQQTLASCCLLSHQWYSAAVPLLYAQPYLYGKNFDPFVRAICPSINLSVRESPLSRLVKSLNMSNLVHQASKRLTARLLGRMKGNLEEFVAPQASFGINCFPALSKCLHLRTLDLSLVSESPPLPELFKTVSRLLQLRTFRLPRSAGFGVHHKAESFSWPPNVEQLSLSGGIDAHFLHGVVGFPHTLRSLAIEHCPLAKGYAVTHLLKKAVRPLQNLESLRIRYMPRLGSHALDDVLFLLPQIRKLSISVDYITPALFDEGHFNHFKDPILTMADNDQPSSDVLVHSNLRTLELTNSNNPGVEDKISPIDVMIAIDEGTLPRLRVVRVAKSLLWHSSTTERDAEALADVLQEASRKDWECGEGPFRAVDSMGRSRKVDTAKAEREKVWEAVAGVWMFDDASLR